MKTPKADSPSLESGPMMPLPVQGTESRVYLVLVEDGGLYVDSAWTTPEGAARRSDDIVNSRSAFRSYDAKALRTLGIQLDAGGMAVHVHLPIPEPYVSRITVDNTGKG